MSAPRQQLEPDYEHRCAEHEHEHDRGAGWFSLDVSYPSTAELASVER